MKTAYVTLKKLGKIAEIEFYNPASNSLTSNQLQKLTTLILQQKENKQISIIHLKSDGEKAFCAGASFDELLQIEEVNKGTQFFMGFANVINAIRTCGKIVVTSIQGKVVGGGVGIAAASDYVLAAKSASIKLSEISIGIGPFVIEPAVSKAIGNRKFAELSLNPTCWKSSGWAYENGLYQEVCDDFATLNIRTKNYLNELASYSEIALSEMKKILWKQTENWEVLLKERASVSGELVLSEATKKALLKFKKK
ncbi:enoyl-CoA hydratase/isomerase family protein [Ochrovirga pacifica]|uniref:enoyl-CoA hydratase/isomerase family protein n=1 Tax=Ochrovirga pacifica TaxID=1042376 RepID=UPI0002558352|nr:enoyl-CoA hydratase/isomerase family protein [Ochrovirga pacifica]